MSPPYQWPTEYPTTLQHVDGSFPLWANGLELEHDGAATNYPTPYPTPFPALPYPTLQTPPVRTHIEGGGHRGMLQALDVCPPGSFGDGQSIVTTLSGDSDIGGFADGTAAAARFQGPYSVAWSPDSLYVVVTDQNNHRVRRIIVLNGDSATLAGSGTPGFADGGAAVAQFSSPAGVTFSPSGAHIAVADSMNHRIRRIDTSSGAVATLAGSGTSQGTLTAAQQQHNLASPRACRTHRMASTSRWPTMETGASAMYIHLPVSSPR